MKMNRKYYFTLRECIKNVLGVEAPYSATNNISTLCTALNINTDLLPFEITEHMQRLWKEIYALNYDEIVYIKSYEEIREEDFKTWFYMFISKLSRTFERYEAILNGYDTLKNKLVDDIKTSTDTTIKYNDTPQNDAVSGFDDDNHTTNITNTHNESTTPFATPMEKLKSLQDNYQMVYNKWCKEFGNLFIEEQTTWGC